MERRSTLPVNEIQASERQERSWESAAMPGRWGHPSAADRGRGVDDLDMAGLNIGAPTRLQRGCRALPPAGVSTPLGGDSGELPRTYSGSLARADYWRRLKLNAQDSVEDVLFRRDELPREGSRWLLRSSTSRCRGEQRISACAAAGRVRVRDSIRGGFRERQETTPRLPGGQAQRWP